MKIPQTVERWFQVPDDPHQARILIRHLEPTELAEIFDNAQIQETVYPVGQDGVPGEPQIHFRQDRAAERLAILDARVQGWDGVLDEQGQPLACTRDHKALLARKVRGFLRFIGECSQRLSEDVAREREAEEKNSDASRSGSPA